MANTIKPKRTGTSGKVPLTTDLEVGEIAVNMADGILYVRDALGTVKEVGKNVDTSNLLPKAGGTITGDLTVSNFLNANGASYFNNTVRLGQTSADAITVNGNTTFNGSTTGLEYSDINNTPDLSPYATTVYVDNEISSIDLSPYATTAYVDTEISNIPAVDLSAYSTTTEMNTAIASAQPNLAPYALTAGDSYSGTHTFTGTLRSNGTFRNNGAHVEHYSNLGSTHSNWSPNPSDGSVQELSISGSSLTFAGFQGATAGQCITFIIKQNNIGNATWGDMHPTTCYYAGGNNELTQTAGARDIITILYVGSNQYYISIANGFS